MKTPLILQCILFSLCSTTLQAQPGTLDSGFGNGGKTTTNFGSNVDQANAVAIQPDGKIVVAGGTVSNQQFDFAIARFNADGTLDNSFSGDGKVTTVFSTGNDVAYGVAIQADGKIVAVGYAGSDDLAESSFAVARYNTNGTLDASFGMGGILTTPITTGFEGANAVAIQPDGKIIAAGSLHDLFDLDFGLARYLPNGALDSTFSADGKVTTHFGEILNDAYAVALQPDGKIVAAGRTFISPLLNFCLARYNTDGSLDASFGMGGKLTTNVDNKGGWARSLAIQPDGKIIAFGYVESNSEVDFAIARYLPDGALDASFGNEGAFVIPNTEEGRAVMLQPDGKIIIAGSKDNGVPGTNYDFALMRLNADGSPDNSFGANGLVSTSFSNHEDMVTALALQPDGKIVAVGNADNGQNNDFAIARYRSGLTIGVLDFSAFNPYLLVFPNPIYEQATLDYTLPEAMNISIHLVDIHGKTLQSYLENNAQAAGAHQQNLVWPAGLPSGIYWLVLDNQKGQVKIKLVK